jgi:hypothetical protein
MATQLSGLRWYSTEYTQSGNDHFLAYIKIEKPAQSSDGRGWTPTPFTISTITNKVAVYAPAERADTFPLFLLHPYMCTLWGTPQYTVLFVRIKLYM